MSDTLSQHRHTTPLTWRTAPYAHVFLIPLFFLAYLTRRPHTHLIRLLVLPVFVIVTLECTTRYRIEDPNFGWCNWIRGFAALAVIAHAIYFAVNPEGMLKVGEGSLGDTNRSLPEPKVAGVLPACIIDAFEVVSTTRGIGWQFSSGLKVPATRRPAERRAYLKATYLSMLQTILLIDLFDSFIESLPGITTTSRSMFFPTLPPLLRYTVSTAIHLFTGFVVTKGFELWSDILSLIGIGLFGQPPSAWPPVHDRPWHTSSLHDFWSRRWHQMLRHTLLVYGGYPGRWLAGDVGMLFGVFLASGLFHELGMYLVGTSIDLRVVVFFAAQAVGILAEKLYKKYTGKRVDGWPGTLWASIFIVGLGQICMDSWIGRGAGGAALIPPSFSLIRLYLVPTLRTLIGR